MFALMAAVTKVANVIAKITRDSCVVHEHGPCLSAQHLFLYYCIKIRLILKCPDFGYPFSPPRKKKTAFLQQNDKYGWVMLRSHNNADNHLEKRREHLVRNRVKKYLSLHALDYWLEHTYFMEICQTKLSGST
jgi:hypothetical protein